MTDEKHLMIIKKYKNQIITKWIREFIHCYPEYDRKVLKKDAEGFYTYMSDLHIPAAEHSRFLAIPESQKVFLKRNVSISHVVHSSQLWIDAILWFIQENPRGKTISMSLTRKIIARVSLYERYFLHQYNTITKELLSGQEQTITELHEARLTIIGKMAASMAHEIRNPLTAILGFLKILRKQLSIQNHQKISSYLDTIESELLSIQMQIAGFLSFSKKDAIEESFEEVSSTSIIDNVLAMLAPRLVNDNIELIFQQGDDIKLKVQKIAIQQVLSNILNNSLDALSEKEGEKGLKIASMLEDDEFLIIISNNGPEIPPEIKDSLFIPFVTNKKDGTGLGLAICKQIMTKNKGDVTFDSSPNETSFRLSFKQR
ncbi:sensor histidine kinase [Paenibacillus alginolyticus]|uniref:histidine kinase n=1 Tax=Paenibacillus alginolyticus TaxID=59839 RepID=A0ABT4GFC9_9BACL|nr:HAMP domain-containing sensor histidine kinase [Paenibacillus alginolyticus]MCY9694895.1 HAMP domain-containing histidine kinase [Paenibacillus alginolyticus]MEC0143098.1 HAMP domain-containing sensor histidine kinase [Paenibacillus alginolyticus]